MPDIGGLISPWSALSMTMITDTAFNSIFGQWVKAKLDTYKATDDHIESKFARLANDGLWLQFMTKVIDFVVFP